MGYAITFYSKSRSFSVMPLRKKITVGRLGKKPHLA